MRSQQACLPRGGHLELERRYCQNSSEIKCCQRDAVRRARSKVGFLSRVCRTRSCRPITRRKCIMGVPRYSLRILLGLVTATAVSTALLVFLRRPGPNYSASQVQVHGEGLHSGSIKLHFSVPHERSHYCPGVNYERVGDKLLVYYPRVPRREDDPDVQSRAVPQPDGSLAVEIPLDPSKDLPVTVLIDGTRNLGKWAPAEQGVSRSKVTDRSGRKDARERGAR